jgi:glycosyltransferase involved in cell wall biosynthesis
MRVLYAYNQHRGGNGSINSTLGTIAVSRRHGVEVEVFTRDSRDLPPNLLGRFQAGASAIYAPGSVKQFSALLDSFEPDLVHVYDLFPLISPWILPICTQREIPVVATCDDYLLTCPVRNHLRKQQICTRCIGGREYWAVLNNCRHNIAESLVLAFHSAMVRKLGLFRKHVSRFITGSDFTRRWLVEHLGIENSRVSTIPHMVEIPESAADPGTGGYVAFAGRFVPEKGIGILLEAARLCQVPFCLSRNEKQSPAVELPPQVDVVVTRRRDELNAFYRGARMLVFPSIWFETFGVVGAEAMSHGIPVVASRIGALSCLVEDGADGLLFEPGNPRDLAEKIARLWGDPEFCRRLGRAARQKACRLWSAQSHFAHLFTVYQEVCGGDQRQGDSPLRSESRASTNS